MQKVCQGDIMLGNLCRDSETACSRVQGRHLVLRLHMHHGEADVLPTGCGARAHHDARCLKLTLSCPKTPWVVIVQASRRC